MIRTTVVGSYPVPTWLKVYSTRESLRDAMMAVLKTQELAGIDVVADGELSRFDVNHPETNGMIDYFVRPLSGVRAGLSRAEREEFRRQAHMGFRAQPAGVVQGPLDEGTLDLPAAFAAVSGLTDRPMKFTVTSPYMLARTLLDRHYRDRRALTLALAEVLRRQVAAVDAAVLQVDEANLPGSPADGPWAAEAINRVLGGFAGEKVTQLRQVGRRTISLDTPVGEEGDTVVGDVIVDTEVLQAPEVAEYRGLAEQLKATMDALPPQEALVLTLRYGFHNGRPRTVQQIADQVGLTPARVRQLEKQALAQLRAPERYMPLAAWAA